MADRISFSGSEVPHYLLCWLLLCWKSVIMGKDRDHPAGLW